MALNEIITKEDQSQLGDLVKKHLPALAAEQVQRLIEENKKQQSYIEGLEGKVKEANEGKIRSQESEEQYKKEAEELRSKLSEYTDIELKHQDNEHIRNELQLQKIKTENESLRRQDVVNVVKIVFRNSYIRESVMRQSGGEYDPNTGNTAPFKNETTTTDKHNLQEGDLPES